MPFSPPNVWRALQTGSAREAWERSRSHGRNSEVAAD
jgi:hypothetical protein